MSTDASFLPSAAELGFAICPNVTAGTARRFFEKGVTPKDFFVRSAENLAEITGVRPSMFSLERRKKALARAAEELRFMEANNVRAFLSWSDDYPLRLRDCDDAPAALFAMGNITTMPHHSVAIVGTRNCTAYGAEVTRRIVEDLADSLDDVVIMSGLALGIDIVAHRAAMDKGIPTGAILAHGLSTIYPSVHRNYARDILRNGGFLATEYISDTPIHRGNFPARNRIVAGLSDVTVVVESDTHGGALITASIAAAYGREVGAVPGRIYDQMSRGCNSLIHSNRAFVVRDADDIIKAMQWKAKAKPGVQQELPVLTEEQQAVVDLLTVDSEATVNDICVRLNIPYARLSAMLFELEMNDVVVSRPGGRYAVTVPPK